MKKKKISKKIKIILITVLIAFFMCLFIIPDTLSRYVLMKIKDYYLETKSFYFNCDKMASQEAIYQLDNWDGVNSFAVTFNMNSFKNNLIRANSDIAYSISYTCSSNVDCIASKDEGLITASSNQDYFVITINPNVVLVEGDSVWLEVSATSESPYVKTISGKVTLNIGVPGLSYEIIDQKNQPYLNFDVTNTLYYYRVIEAFDDKSVGTTISSSEYLSLSDVNKKKCASAVIKLTFDPQDVLLDLTSEVYLNAISYTTKRINGYDYVDSIVFGMEAISSIYVRFYKVDATRNYTYPYVNTASVIDFEVL